jgi:hypothetical protein
MNFLALLADFSRSNCIGICATLVPVMLGSTLSYLGVTYFRQRQFWGNFTYGCTIIACVLMGLHVSSWFSIGIVTPVTFILLGLSLTCFSVCSLALVAKRWPILKPQEVVH